MARDSEVSGERLKKLLPTADTELEYTIDRMIKCRRETVSQLSDIANRIDQRRRDVNIAKVIGGAVGAAGAIALLLVPGGRLLGTLTTLGTVAVFGAGLVETIKQKQYLEMVHRQEVERDKKQCRNVRNLWKKFKEYNESIDTIAFADPSEMSDMTSLKTWVKAIKDNTVFVIVAGIIGNIICPGSGSWLDKHSILEKYADKYGLNLSSLVRSVTSEHFNLFCSILKKSALIVIAAFGVINTIISLVDLHTGSLSPVADDIRSKERMLKDELDTWRKIFGHQHR